MREPSRRPDDAEHAFWLWLGFWLELLIFGVLAVVGAFVASHATEPGDYTCGILLSLAAIAMAFLRLKRQLDGGEFGWGNFLLVDDMWNLALVIPIFAVTGLAGLLLAHGWESGAMHSAGIALFIASGVIIFLNIKRVYDRINSNPH
ncbi:MAG: hypothetical protein J2P48_16990 [Alphaproteobacteria bacterium]|nr:hypothetical protein [Alphaproteobacteria bacterium]